jgi:hypothetical protein
MSENKIDISNLSEVKQSLLLFPDDILIKAINIATALQNDRLIRGDSMRDYKPESINLDNSIPKYSIEEMTKRAKEEYQLIAKELLEKNKNLKEQPQQNMDVIPPVEKQSIFEKAKSLAKAYASRGLSNNKAEEPIKSLRVLSCHGNADLPACPHRVKSEKFKDSYYCGACGCGDRSPTQLVNVINTEGKEEYSKLDFPKVVCPLGMPGFSNYEKWKEEDQNPRKNVIESMFGIEYIMNNSNLENTEKESENNENSDDNQSNKENS